MAYTIVNTPNTQEWWTTSSFVGNTAVGDYLKGQVSSATGMLVDYKLTLGGAKQGVYFIVMSGVFNAGGETITCESGGNFITGSKKTTTSDNMIWVQGSLDATSGSFTYNTISSASGIDTGVTLADSISADLAQIVVDNGAPITAGTILLVGSELIKCGTVHPGHTITSVRGAFGSTRAVHDSGTSLYRVSFAVDDADDFEYGELIHVDNEYMQITYLHSASNLLFCDRGLFSTTVSTHAISTTVDIVDDNLFYEIWNASNGGGWGYDTITSNKQEIHADIVLGSPTQTSINYFHSKNEFVTIRGSVLPVGNSSNTSYFQAGRGRNGEDQSSAEGSTIYSTADRQLLGGISCTRFGKTYLYACNLTHKMFRDGGVVQRCNFTVKKDGSGNIDTINCTVYDFGYGTDTTVWRDIVNNYGAFNPGSGRMTFNRLIAGDNDYGLYFLTSNGANPEINDLTLLSCPQEVFMFVDTGNKYVINSSVNIDRWSGFWSSGFYYEQYTVDMTFSTPAGDAIQNMRVRVWNATQDPLADAALFDVTTDAAGAIAQQTITNKYRPSEGSTTEYSPFTFFFNLAGFREVIKTHSFTEQIDWQEVIHNVSEDFS